MSPHSVKDPGSDLEVQQGLSGGSLSLHVVPVPAGVSSGYWGFLGVPGFRQGTRVFVGEPGFHQGIGVSSGRSGFL